MRLRDNFLCACCLLGVTASSSFASFLDFTAAEGFVSGGINGQNGVIAQATVTIPDPVSSVLSIDGPGFGRGIFFNGDADLAVAANLAVGETLTLTAAGITIDRATGNFPALVVGLTNSILSGGAQNIIGGQLRVDGSNITLDNQAFGAVAPVDTGFDLGDTFDLSIDIVNNGDGTFDATSTVGAVTLLTADNIAIGVGLDTVGLIAQSLGPPTSTGVTTIDSLAKAVSAIPEPASLMLLAVALGGFAARVRS